MTIEEKSFRYNIDLDNHFTDIAFRLCDDPAFSQGYHYHEGFEIIQVWSDGGCVLIEDMIYPMEKGHIYIINSLESHCTNPSQDTPYIRNKITFSPYYIRTLMDQMGSLQLLDPFLSRGKNFFHSINPDDTMSAEFDRLFEVICREYTMSNSGYTASISSCIIQMLVMIYRWYEKNANKISQSSLAINAHVKSTIEYINMHLLEDIAIEGISNDLHLNKYYLCHLFKHFTGVTIMQYLIERRVSLSKNMLISSTVPISEIAMRCGFKSFSLFSRTFKRITGITPIEYRTKFKPA